MGPIKTLLPGVRILICPFDLNAKQQFPGFFFHFSLPFLHFQDLNMIAMQNSHLVLRKETLKQHFEK